MKEIFDIYGKLSITIKPFLFAGKRALSGRSRVKGKMLGKE
jgi:hypothetical protein